MNDPCVIRLPRSRSVRRLGLLALVAVVVAGMGPVAVWSNSSAAHAVPASTGLARLPLATRTPVSRALGQDDPSYWAQRSAGGLVIVNRAQRLGAQFGRGGVLVDVGGMSLGLSLRAYGYGALLQQLPTVAPRAVSDEVLYAHPGVTESYVNGPLGLEQGFTVAESPASHHGGPLTLDVVLSGNARGRLSVGADGVMFTGGGGSLAYRGLVATDAQGRTLDAWIDLHGSDLLLPIAAAGAKYPIRVDPFLQQARLTASDGSEFDSFGTSVAISGHTIVVGVPDATVGSNFNQGAAHIFVKLASGWTDGTQTAKLTASDGAAGDSFGSSVAMSGGTVVAGAPLATVSGNAFQGAAYVSQINGCAFCMTLHTGMARRAGVDQGKLDTLAGWRDATGFNEAEPGLPEGMTRIGDGSRVGEVTWSTARAVFNDDELATLLCLVGLTNIWNRINVTVDLPSDHQVPAYAVRAN